MKEPTKRNGEPIANTVPAYYLALATGATHALAKKESHPGAYDLGVHKSLGTIVCDGTLRDESSAKVAWSLEISAYEWPATAVLCLYSMFEIEDHTEKTKRSYVEAESTLSGSLTKTRSAVEGKVDAHFCPVFMTERDMVVGYVTVCVVGTETH